MYVQITNKLGQNLFENLFLNGTRIYYMVRNKMKGSLMNMADKIQLRQ